MRVTRIIFFIGVAAIIAATVLFGWLYLPSPRHRSSHIITTEPPSRDTGESLPPEWILEVDAPRRIHLGESGTLRLTLSSESAAPRADPAGDAFASGELFVEARAEMPTAGTSPSGLSSQTLAPGRAARFEWRITPQSEGTLEGRVWLYLRAVPTDGTESIRRPLSVQPVTIHSNTFFGRVTDPVRQTAFIALGIGLALVLPYLLVRTHLRRSRDPAQDRDRQL